jgi:putative ABC transport system permease protein
MSYSLSMLWYDRQRYLPGILAVAFSALLIALQCGLLLGLFSITSIPVDKSRANLWMGAPQVRSVDLGRPILASHMAVLASQPEIDRCEIFIQGFGYWQKPGHGTELCMVIGSRLGPDALGRLPELTPQLCLRLMEPGAVVVDESDLHRLGVKGDGDTAEIGGYRVHIVGTTRGLKSLAGPYVLCSIDTARERLHMVSDQTTYVLAHCRSPQDVSVVADRVNRTHRDITAMSKNGFSIQTRMHWLTRTKAGIALGYAAALGLLVGAVVTSQTLYAATVASLREFAVLRALGIPRWRMMLMVVSQSFWIGIIGIGLAWPAVFALAWAADLLGVKVDLPWWLQAGATGVTLMMALMAGLFALRSLRLVEPATLLR